MTNNSLDQKALSGEQVPSAPHRVLTLDFTNIGDGRAALGEGWSHQEPKYIWTEAVRSELLMPSLGPQTQNIGLSVYLHPLIMLPHCQSQRFWIEIGDARSQEVALRAPGWLHVVFPGALFEQARTIFFNQPGAFRPADIGQVDTRWLGVAIETLSAWQAPAGMAESVRAKLFAELESRRLKLAEKELLRRFESLGSNCELGVLQQSFDIDQVRLLRFAYTPYGSLLSALKDRFEGMGSADSLVIEPAGSQSEYMIQDTRFGIRYHSQIRSDQISPDDLLKREVARIAFLRRQLLELLAAGESIFVYVADVFLGDPPLGENDAVHLADQLKAYGEVTLLWVAVASSPAQAGTVREVRRGLMIGYIDRLCNPHYPPMLVSATCWLSICNQAEQLFLRWKATERPAAKAPPRAPAGASAPEAHEPSPSWRILLGHPPDFEQAPRSPVRQSWIARLVAMFGRS